MLELIQDIVFNVTGKKGLTLETDFIQDLELNSLDIMNIICEFENYFGAPIPTRDVWRLNKVSDVIEYIYKRGLDKR